MPRNKGHLRFIEFLDGGTWIHLAAFYKYELPDILSYLREFSPSREIRFRVAGHDNWCYSTVAEFIANVK